MPITRIVTQGFTEFDGQLARLTDTQARRVLLRSASEPATIVVRAARQNARTAFRSQSGLLKRSIRKISRRGIVRIQAGERFLAEHAQLIEYGHRVFSHGVDTGKRAKARPFLGPALDKNKEKVSAMFIAELRRNLDRVLNKVKR